MLRSWKVFICVFPRIFAMTFVIIPISLPKQNNQSVCRIIFFPFRVPAISIRSTCFLNFNGPIYCLQLLCRCLSIEVLAVLTTVTHTLSRILWKVFVQILIGLKSARPLKNAQSSSTTTILRIKCLVSSSTESAGLETRQRILMICMKNPRTAGTKSGKITLTTFMNFIKVN